MLYILYGEDDFSLRHALAKLSEGLDAGDLAAANTTIFEGRHLSLEQLIGTCDTTPFLAPRRLVIVEGLLSRFERRDRGQRKSPPELEEWRGLADYAARMPQSTMLALADGKLRKDNPLLKALAKGSEVREFPSLRGEGLYEWVRARVKGGGGDISPRAVRLLAGLVGANLWLLSSELDKLCLYTGGRRIEEGDVLALISNAREASVFEMVDSILQRQPKPAIGLLHKLLDEGATPTYLLFMIIRQFRLALQAKDLLARRLPMGEMASSLGLTSDYALRKTVEQAKRYPLAQLREIYRSLLDTDVSIKTGVLKGELALDLLLAKLCLPS